MKNIIVIGYGSEGTTVAKRILESIPEAKITVVQSNNKSSQRPEKEPGIIDLEKYELKTINPEWIKSKSKFHK